MRVLRTPGIDLMSLMLPSSVLFADAADRSAGSGIGDVGSVTSTGEACQKRFDAQLRSMSQRWDLLDKTLISMGRQHA